MTFIHDDRTGYLSLALPHLENMQTDDIPRIRDAFRDVDVFAQNSAQKQEQESLLLSQQVERITGAEMRVATLETTASEFEAVTAPATGTSRGTVKGGGRNVTLRADGTIDVDVEPTRVLSAPVLSIASQVAIGFTATLQITDGAIKICDTDHYEVQIGSGAWTDVPAVNGSATFTFTPTGTAGQQLSISVVAVDKLENLSVVASATTEQIIASISPAVILSPTAGEQSVSLSPVLTLSPMSVLGGIADTAKYLQVQIAKDADFTTVVFDTGETGSPTTSVSVTPPLDRITTFYARAKWEGTTFGKGTWSAVVSFETLDALVVGVCQTTDGSVGQSFARIDMNGNAPVENPVFNTHPVYAGIQQATIDGQHMIGYPKFFVKREVLATGAYTGKDARMLSDVALPGYDIHPAFLAKDGTNALDMVWLGKYQACDAGSSKAGSLPSKTPLVNIDFNTMKTRCTNRNTGGVSGFHLWNVHELSIVQLMMLIEFAGTDMQTLVGRGHVDNNPSGVQNVDHAKVLEASWRGLTGIWGNIWQMCDGFRCGASKYKIDSGKGFVETTIAAPSTDFCPNKMLSAFGSGWSFKHLFFGDPAHKGSSEADSTFSDKQWLYTNSSDYVLYSGGSYSYAASAGLFCASVYNDAARSSGLIGGRLAKW